MANQTIAGMLLEAVAKDPETCAIRTRRDGGPFQDVSWRELGERMEKIAAGMLSTAAGELPDDAHIAILGNTSEDWISVDFACLSIGLRTVPVYATLLPDEVGYLHVDTGSMISVVDDKAQLEKVREMKKGFTFFEEEYAADRVLVKHIIVIDPEGIEAADDWESLADLEARGEKKLKETADERKRRADACKREETATYTYTSGTTGPPKGVIQTHENHMSMVESMAQTGILDDSIEEAGLFLFLPLAHSFGRLIEFASPFFHAPIVISGVPTLGDDLKEARPGFIPAAPRVYEKMKARIESAVAGASGTKKALFNWSINAGRATIPYRSKGQPVPFFTGLKYGWADKLVLSKLRAKLGMDRASTLISGSAPLNVEVHEFFLACGLDLLEAYGLTETCPGLTANLPDKFSLGTVGVAFPGVTIKIAGDGEILAKGPNITSGYLNRDDATAEAFDDEGWFHTGDLGSMDDEGFVKITGRKKELMKTSGGKYIAPAKLEGRLKNLSMVQEAVTIADTRNYVTALIAIDPEELEEWAKQTGNEADASSDAVKAAVQAHVDEVNETLAKYETIKYFHIVPPMTIDSGLLTASLKVKRKVVYEKYAGEIDGMYKGKKKAA